MIFSPPHPITNVECPPPKSGKNHNNSSHRSYECPPPLAGGVIACDDGGWKNNNYLSPHRGTKFPSAEGWRLRRRGGLPRMPAPQPPAQQILCHSRAGGNRAVVVISYLIWGNNSALYFYYYKICDMNLVDPIPALSTPQTHSCLRGPRARE